MNKYSNLDGSTYLVPGYKKFKRVRDELCLK